MPVTIAVIYHAIWRETHKIKYKNARNACRTLHFFYDLALPSYQRICFLVEWNDGGGISGLDGLLHDFWSSLLAQCAYCSASTQGMSASLRCTEGGLVVSPNENKRRALALRALVGTAPAAGTKTVIVTHKPNVIDKDWFEVKEGETTIFRPAPPGFHVVARFQIDEWPHIAAAAKR
jgi:hypothetical protein